MVWNYGRDILILSILESSFFFFGILWVFFFFFFLSFFFWNSSKGLLWVVLICPPLLLRGLLVIESLNWRKSCTSHRQETAEKQSRKYKNKSVKKRFGGGLIHKIPRILCQKQKTSSLLWIHIELPILIIHFDNYDTFWIDFSTLICPKWVSVCVSNCDLMMDKMERFCYRESLCKCDVLVNLGTEHRRWLKK